MDKQRGIYRQLLVKLFEQNFTSALFVEKLDTMMKISDFEQIRNEIEEDYYTKNRGIAPYITAIKYLCKKIQSCTADNTLFTPIEEYICAKENIVVTKIPKGKIKCDKREFVIVIKYDSKKPTISSKFACIIAVAVPVKVVAAKSKKPKGRKRLAKESTPTSNSVGHAECVSPNPCKKCRIMRRLGKFSIILFF